MTAPLFVLKKIMRISDIEFSLQKYSGAKTCFHLSVRHREIVNLKTCFETFIEHVPGCFHLL